MTLVVWCQHRRARRFGSVRGNGFYRCHLFVWDVGKMSCLARMEPAGLVNTWRSFLPLPFNFLCPSSQSPHLSSSHLPKHFSGACSFTFRLFKQPSGANWVYVAESTWFGAGKVEPTLSGCERWRLVTWELANVDTNECFIVRTLKTLACVWFQLYQWGKVWIWVRFKHSKTR